MSIKPEIRKILYHYYQQRTKSSQVALESATNDKAREQDLLVDNIIGKENSKMITSKKMPHKRKQLRANYDSQSSDEEDEKQAESIGFGSRLLSEDSATKIN